MLRFTVITRLEGDDDPVSDRIGQGQRPSNCRALAPTCTVIRVRAGWVDEAVAGCCACIGPSHKQKHPKEEQHSTSFSHAQSK